MAIDWVVASEILVKMYESYTEYEEQQADRERFEELKKLIVDLVIGAKQAIADLLKEMRLEELESELLAATKTLGKYDRVEADKPRLDYVDGRLDSIMAALERVIDKIEDDPKFAIKAFFPYATSVTLDVFVLRERSFAFEGDDTKDIPPILETALGYTAKIKKELRKQSDTRFSSIFFQDIVPNDEGVAYYLFEENDGKKNKNICGSYVYHGAGTLTKQQAIKDCENALEKHKRSAFEKYPGVEQVLGFESFASSAIFRLKSK
ncbi:MAG TPA: hypothetical protein PLM24_00215 [Methanothrix sp.]|nr:hypothetical protein [Methanothrix sp.]HPJ84349.1 hypothetical protein [Methanothrix sp.]HPR65540.1 hypothetical protein [Methanothrix sp.]